MVQLFSLLFVITLIFYVQKEHPILAGFVAVIPIKIICTSIFALNNGNLRESVGGMLIGQFIVGFILLGVYVYLSKGTL